MAMHKQMLGVLIIAFMVAACGRNRESPPPPATALPDVANTIASTSAAVTAAENLSAVDLSATLIDTELLGNPALMGVCDGSDGVDFSCTNAATMVGPILTVDIDGGAYARWSLRAETVTTALTGDETLLLHLRRSGNVTPNLYLVERSGRRTAVALARFGLAEGEQVLAIPLREIRDDARQWPNFADVNEIQIVFEWAEMAGTLDLYSLQFASRWQMAVPVATESQALADSLVVHAGFTIRAIADQLRETTQLSVTDDGTLWASTQSGRIWRYTDSDGDGLFDQRLLYATGFEEVVGLLYDPTDGALWVGGRGQLYRLLDGDGNGVADQRELRLDGLPWGRHQNNGLAWNPDPDPFTGETGHHWIYFGLGSTEDLVVGGEWNAQVLRFPGRVMVKAIYRP
ncbi:MAG: hypothetical protein R2867_33845 [Caldilineaceae bacterium]